MEEVSRRAAASNGLFSESKYQFNRKNLSLKDKDFVRSSKFSIIHFEYATRRLIYSKIIAELKFRSKVSNYGILP